MLPNVFLIGAAKSGTTSLANWLGEHPDAFLPDIKEPSYFSSDYRGGYRTRFPQGEASYRAMYSLSERARVRLDASTNYLFSEVALERIVETVHDARFMVLLRDPTEIAYAFHMEQIFNTLEDEADFEVAWELQEARLRGERIPTSCFEPKMLQYRTICSLGSHLEHLFALVPEERRLVIFLMDMQLDAKSVYQRVLAFLDLDDDGRNTFPVANSAHFQRFPRLARLYMNPPGALEPVVRGGRRALDATGLTKLAKFALRRRGRRRAMSDAMERRLRETFAPEVRKIEALTGRDLSAWLPTASRASAVGE